MFAFHSSRFFDLDGWHVKNATTYLGVQIWTSFLAHWMMPPPQQREMVERFIDYMNPVSLRSAGVLSIIRLHCRMSGLPRSVPQP